MHVYQMRSSNQSIVSATQQRLTVCMNALKDVSKTWLVAKMVHTLFESILGNKVLEDRLQKAAGRRHAKSKHNGASSRASKSTPAGEVEAQKRKFDEMELGYTNGPPAPQMSYERSRPQSPAITPSREVPPAGQGTQQQLQMPQMTATSPTLRHGTDTFMGASRNNTRPTTPSFNTLPWSRLGSPDVFLHTRNSPKISEDLWQNYQPEQLFPPETNGLFPITSNSPSQMVDPALRTQSHSNSQFPPQHQLGTPQIQQAQQMPIGDGHAAPGMQYQQDSAAWAQLNTMGDQTRPDDAWSDRSSTGGPVVPTTLNVGDWFEFFGIPNGSDINGLNGAAGYG